MLFVLFCFVLFCCMLLLFNCLSDDCFSLLWVSKRYCNHNTFKALPFISVVTFSVLYFKIAIHWAIRILLILRLFLWLRWGLTTRQPLWVILCLLPEKGRKEIEEMVEEMKERDREEIGTWMKVKKKGGRKKKHSPFTFTCYKDSRPCPTVSQYQLDVPVTKIYDTFAPPDHPIILRQKLT